MLTRLVDDFDIAFEWRGFELHPNTPRGGIALERMFGAARVAQMKPYMQEFSRSFGVTMGHPDRMPNTRRALAIAEFARDAGRLHPWREAAMEAHWNRGLDIEADATLHTLAGEAGLDADAAVRAADDPVYQARVDAMGAEAARWGVTGIPTYFVLPDGWAPGDPAPADGRRPVRIVGCQPYETVQAACMRAGVGRRA